MSYIVILKLNSNKASIPVTDVLIIPALKSVTKIELFSLDGHPLGSLSQGQASF